MTPLPTSTSRSGWPEFLYDSKGDLFVRLRDGVPTGEFTGHAVQYGLVDPETDMLVREHLFTPTILSTTVDVLMSGGTWMDPEQMQSAGIPPITIPEEPITPPIGNPT